MSEQLHVEATIHPHQYIVHNVPIADREGREFNEVYVNFSGYFGRHGPQVFAAAPELLEALSILLANLESDIECDGHDPADDARIKMARAAIAKATGE